MTEVMSKVMSCRTLLCRSMHMRFAFLRPAEQYSWNSILAFQHPFQGLCNQRTIKEMILGIKLSTPYFHQHEMEEPMGSHSLLL
jgi:hypothetical protein